jgi:hypothetical protein
MRCGERGCQTGELEGWVGKERKVFFFEKKNQKTFARSGPNMRAAVNQMDKSFLLLFFKKEALA